MSPLSSIHNATGSDFERRRQQTQLKRKETFNLYQQAQQLNYGQTSNDNDKALFTTVIEKIKRGVSLATTPEELALHDLEQSSSVGAGYRRTHSAQLMNNADLAGVKLRRYNSLNNLWNNADAYLKEEAKDLHDQGRSHFSKLPQPILNALLQNALNRYHLHNVKPLQDLGARAAKEITADDLLKMAAHRGDLEIIQQCLKAGADINQEDKKGWTAVTLAARAGQHEAESLLKKMGALDDCSQIMAEEIAPQMVSTSPAEQSKGLKKLLMTIPLEKRQQAHAPHHKALNRQA
ncbi:ankyrin repeat domain-containing protein [Vampirovibrio sp.]|uniref:ankyrin repeat domain-containing protein n=1 Tax=Vampirovibrio sp. TaxID=2717857 RepID=UPI003594292E